MNESQLPVVLCLLAGASFAACAGDAPKPDATPAPQVDVVAPNPCELPKTAAASPEQTAWQIFVAVNCPTGNSATPLVWETWTEQTCLTDPSNAACAPNATTRMLHGSHLKLRGALPTVPLINECNAMLTKATAVGKFAPLARFVPSNLAAAPTFCEEVFINRAELAYIQAPAPGQTLTTLAAQNTYVTTGATIDFPTDAVEVKADWIPASSLVAPTFDCVNPPAGLVTETIGGQCYALAGMHISSKLYPNWLWATFEPQSTITNPNRCKTDLYGECVDAYGSTPPTSQGADTTLTPAVSQLMAAAKLAPAFTNYRLTGAQTDFTNATVTELGSSFVEFNAEVLPHQASCITCHYSARFDNSTNPPTGGSGRPPKGSVNVGGPTQQPPNLISEDFSWLLGFMPQTATAAAPK